VQHHRDQDTEDPADGTDENSDQVDRDVGPANDAHQVEEIDEPEEDHAHDCVDDERGDAFDHFIEDKGDNDYQDEGKERCEEAHTARLVPQVLKPSRAHLVEHCILFCGFWRGSRGRSRRGVERSWGRARGWTQENNLFPRLSPHAVDRGGYHPRGGDRGGGSPP